MKKTWFGLLALVAVLASCGAPSDEAAVPATTPPPPPAEPVVVESDLELLTASAVDSALITFVSGDAWLIDDGEEVYADIGDTLLPGVVLSVESGYVELQAGTIGTIRVQENSRLRMDQITLAPDGSSVDVRVLSGRVLNKVERLAGNDSFNVRTETAVMGVRGTEFGVNVDPVTGTRVAVRTGRVAVVPAAADPQLLRERAAAAGEGAEVVEAAIRRLEEQAPVIEAEQEISIDETDQEEAAAAVVEVERVIEEVVQEQAAGRQIDTAAIEQRLNTATEETITRTRETTEQRRQVITEASRQELQEIDEVRFIPVAAVQPVLVPVVLRVDPPEAQIALNGRVVARGRFSSVYQGGEQLEFEITREGYEPFRLSVTVEEQRGRNWDIQLARLPQQVPEATPEPVDITVNIATLPTSAQLLIDGQVVGTGTYSQQFAPGTELTIRAELEGYDPVEQRLLVEDGVQPVRLTLEPVVPPATDPTPPVEESSPAEPPPPPPLPGTVSIAVSPADAQIRINGDVAGTGSVRREYPAGTRLDLQISREGYAPLAVPVTVQEGDNNLSWELARTLGTLRISARPANARIRIDGADLGTGTVTQQLPTGQEVTVEVSADGYLAQRRSVVLTAGTIPLSFALERQLARVVVTVEPADARVTIGGRSAGTGRSEQQVPVGETLEVTATRPGFAPGRATVQVGPAGATVPVRLEPRPLERVSPIATTPLVRGLANIAGGVVGVDRDGSLFGISASGDPRWSVQTGNGGNENSLPVASGNRIAFSGSGEFVVVDSGNGSITGRHTLTGTDSHIFGRRAAMWNDQWVYPTDDELLVYDRDGRSIVRRIQIPGGSKSSAAVSGSMAILVNQQGSFQLIDLSSGTAIAAIPTGMQQPVALAPAVAGNRAFAAGRRGTAVAIDTQARSVLWEVSLPGGTGVFVDPVVSGEAVLFLVRDTIVALSIGDGRQLYTLAQAAGAPLIRNGVLYYGTTGGEFRRVDAATGGITGRVTLPAPASGAPTVAGELIAMALRTGSVAFVHPEGIVAQR